MKKIKVFISQPMRYKSDAEILANRKKISEKITAIIGEEVKIIDSFIENSHNDSYLGLLGKSLEKMAEADIVFFAKGWEKMRGCRIEHIAAVEYGLDVMYEGII